LSSLQFFIYFLLRSLAQFVVYVYFRKIYINNKENFELKGPTIIVSNHPNTLIDPVLIASYVKKPIFFLANAGLFKNPIAAKLLRYLYCIEVKRFEDTGNKSLDNTAAFDQSSQHLAANGNIYIAIEGTSYMERVLRPLKTGFARIGFQAITSHAKGQEIFILPIGLNYEKHDKSGFDLEINVGESIPLSHYLVDYDHHNQATIKDLTTEMRSVLEALVIHTEDLDEEALLLNIDALFYGKIKQNPSNVFEEHRTILQHIKRWKQKRSIAFNTWENMFTQFAALLDNYSLSLKILSQVFYKTFPLKEKMVLAALGFPIYFYAWLNHFIAIWVPRWINKKLDFYVGYTSTVKILAAIIFAPIAYILIFILISNHISINVAFINLLILPASAWFLFKYERNIHDLNLYFKWNKMDGTIKKSIESQFGEVVDIWNNEEEKIKISLT
jgi:1-acyl-sn-glycerol-3-phosphate acyltransferase